MELELSLSPKREEKHKSHGIESVPKTGVGFSKGQEKHRKSNTNYLQLELVCPRNGSAVRVRVNIDRVLASASMSCKVLRRADEEDGPPGLVVDCWRSRRSDDGREKKRESARCTIIDHSSTKNKV